MDGEKRDRYRLGSFLFEIRHGGEIPFPPFLERFRDGTGELPQRIYELALVERLPEPVGEQIAQRADLVVYRNASGDTRLETRLFRFAGASAAYGYYEEIDQRFCRSYLQQDFLKFSQVDTVFYSLFALERQLLEQGGIILHCAMLRIGQEALLFSGPSGVGKSCHANLWLSQAEDTEVINGDRALLQKREGRWYACGWCVSGSSGICINESFPVRGIIFLRQKPENGGVRIGGLRAVKQLVSQLTANSWNPQAVTHVWELAEQCAAEVPIYDYGCNLKPAAVHVLQQLLAANEIDDNGGVR